MRMDEFLRIRTVLKGININEVMGIRIPNEINKKDQKANAQRKEHARKKKTEESKEKK
jgi:hypothetical protein